MDKTEVRKRPFTQFTGRMLGNGVDHVDYMRLIERTENGEDWVNVCEELGDKAFAHAEEEIEKSHGLTARLFYLNAESLYRVGQYALIEFTDEKLRLYKKLMDSYAKAVGLYDPPLEEVNIPFKSYNMHGWLWMPKEPPADCPVVVFIPGATGFKEEMHYCVQALVERGMAVLSIDGPGQGVTLIFNGGALEVEIERAHSAMIDHLRDHYPQLGKIGLWGSSTGGYYVARTAATDKRVSACVVRGGSYYPIEVLALSPDWLKKFSRLFLNDDLKYVEKELMPRMTLEGLAQNIECSLLVAHGDPDPVFSLEGVRRLYDEAPTADKTLQIYPDGKHCADDRNTECVTFCADFLADRLIAPTL